MKMNQISRSGNKYDFVSRILYTAVRLDKLLQSEVRFSLIVCIAALNNYY